MSSRPYSSNGSYQLEKRNIHVGMRSKGSVFMKPRLAVVAAARRGWAGLQDILLGYTNAFSFPFITMYDAQGCITHCVR